MYATAAVFAAKSTAVLNTEMAIILVCPSGTSHMPEVIEWDQLEVSTSDQPQPETFEPPWHSKKIIADMPLPKGRELSELGA